MERKEQKNMQSYIAVDLETTGLSPVENEIIEIGAVLVEDGKVKETFSELVKPSVMIPAKITEITGIDDTMVADKKPVGEVLERFLAFAGDRPLLGHNLKFDYSFLKVNGEKIGKRINSTGMDTLKIAKQVLPELSSRSLASLCEYYHVENECAHRAYEDAKATAEIFEKMKKQFQTAFPEAFKPQQMQYKIKKQEPITIKQKKYLLDLLKYHKIKIETILEEDAVSIDELTKSKASKLIDYIILHYGRMY